ISGLARFLNCCGMTALGVVRTSSSAVAIEPFMPWAAGVRMISAPRNARLFHRDDHRGPDAVLHARGRIEIFKLGENCRVGAVLLWHFSQADNWRIADRIDDAVEDTAPAGAVHCTRN